MAFLRTWKSVDRLSVGRGSDTGLLASLNERWMYWKGSTAGVWRVHWPPIPLPGPTPPTHGLRVPPQHHHVCPHLSQLLRLPQHPMGLIQRLKGLPAVGGGARYLLTWYLQSTDLSTPYSYLASSPGFLSGWTRIESFRKALETSRDVQGHSGRPAVEQWVCMGPRAAGNG